jgi:hypothetical protein
MTTRFLTTDQNGNGDQTYWDINGYFLHGPSGEKLNLGGGNSLVTASNEIVQIGTSYLRIPQGVSNERPNPSYAGMIRYLTSEDLIEYYNASDLEWQRIGIGALSITSVSPTILNQGTSNTISLTGKNFNTFSNIQLIGTDSSIFIPDTVNNTLGSTNLTFTCLSGNTILDNSSVEPFYIKVTNNDTGFSTETSPILNINQGSFFILPPGPNLGTFPVQDPCANFYIQGGDTDHPNGNDVSFAIVSANPTPGGFVLTNTSDISATFAPASGSRTDASAQTYNFSCQMTDISGAKSTVQSFNFSLANPTITSIDPSYIYDTSVVDINITGTYFIIDSSISFINSAGGLLTYSEVSYNSITSLTVKDLSAGEVGVYDISLANGSVIVNVPSVVLNIINASSPLISWTITGYSLGSTYEVTYLDSTGTGTANTVGGPVLGGSTVLTIKGTAGSGGTGTISFNTNATTVNYLLVGGGGGGGGNDATNAGGGGAGGGGGGGINFGSATLDTSSVTLNVGTGGTGGGIGGSGGTQALPGGDSTYGGNNGFGGGKGGTPGNGPPASPPDSNATPGGNGGTGGGGAGVADPNTGDGSGGGTGSQGGAGGGPPGSTYFRLGCGGGGGGSSGGIGTIPFVSGENTFGGSGGNGTSYTISGVSVTYGGGGGGGAASGVGLGGSGGSGGGGGGADDSGTPTSGTNFLGGGGGGADDQTDPTGFNNGGSGVIILRFPSFLT